LGGIYTLNPEWQFKAGVGFDETPVTTKYRAVVFPDNDRYAVAIGTHWQPTKPLGVDVGYSHFFLHAAGVHSTIVAGTETVHADGVVHSDANVFGAQLTYRFM
jgi:long-chain fatty acid transport protein